MMQVEAVLQMLQPGFSVAGIAAKRRNKSNPWLKRGTPFRSAVDVLRRVSNLMTPREIAAALIADKAAPATRMQFMDLTAAILRAAEARRRDLGWRGRARKMEVGGCLTAILSPLRLFGAIFPSGRHFK
jgi:hypothetical protein